MREYFVASAIERSLNESVPEPLLSDAILQPEVVFFFAQRFARRPAELPVEALTSLARASRVDAPQGASGGNAAQLLAACLGSLPSQDWSELDLSGAELMGADLSQMSFRIKLAVRPA